MKKSALAILIIIGINNDISCQQFESIRIEKDTSLYSKHLEYSKNIQVTLPQSFSRANSKKYPLIVIFDKQNQINFKYILQSIDYLTALGQIPEAVIVGIDAASGIGRYYETQLLENDSNAKGELYEKFIFDELFPYLKQKYKTNNQTILIGHSRFGYYTSYLLKEHLNELLGVISISPFYVQRKTNLIDELSSKLTTTNSLAHHVYYQFSVGDSIGDGSDYYKLVNKLKSIKLPENFNYNAYEYKNADHIVTPGLTVNQGLYEIFSEWSRFQLQFHRIKNKDVDDSYRLMQDSIKTIYGEKIPFTLGYLNGTGWRFFNDSLFNEAINCWNILIKEHPYFIEGYYFMALGYKELNSTVMAISYIEKALEKLNFNHYYSEKEMKELKMDFTKLEAELRN